MFKLKLERDCGIEDYENSFFIVDDEGNHICDINNYDGRRILKCVNNHDVLVEALQGLIDCDLHENLVGGYQLLIENAEESLNKVKEDKIKKLEIKKEYVITLTRTIEDECEESAIEKFEYELKNEMYDVESIEIELNKSED